MIKLDLRQRQKSYNAEVASKNWENQERWLSTRMFYSDYVDNASLTPQFCVVKDVVS